MLSNRTHTALAVAFNEVPARIPNPYPGTFVPEFNPYGKAQNVYVARGREAADELTRRLREPFLSMIRDQYR